MAFADDLDNGGQEGSSARSRGILIVLWRRKGLVVLLSLLGFLIGCLVYWQRIPVYQSTTQILVIKKRSNDVLPIAGGDPRLTYVEDYIGTHVFLLRSPVIAERAIEKGNLTALRTFEGSRDPVGLIQQSFTVSRDAKDASDGAVNIIRLAFRSNVPEDCGKVLDAMVESYKEFLNVSYKNVSDETLELIVKARDILAKDQAKAEEKYSDFRKRTPLIARNGKTGVSVEVERVSSLEAKRSELVIRQAELRERVKIVEKAIEEGKGAEALQILMRPTDGKKVDVEKTLEFQLLPLLLQESELLESFGDGHPQVQSVRKRIALMREHMTKAGVSEVPKDVKALLERPLLLLRGELSETQLVLDSLGKVIDKLKTETKDLTNEEIEEDRLRSDIDRVHKLYEGTIKRLQEINLVRDTGGFDARPLARGGDGIKIAPSAFQIITGGLLLGVLSGVGLAFLADFSDKGFRNADELRQRLGLTILGHIPLLKSDPDVVRKVEAGELIGDPMLCALFKPKSMETEAYRAVRTALYFSTHGETHRVLQVSSPSKGDGKSLTVANLAISMAQSGKKILVIDADCRRPRQYKIFGLSGEVGLTSVLCDQVPWQNAVQATEVEGLSLMPSGPVPPNPSELLSSPKFAELLATVRPEFDYILVDTPPLLAVTDPSVVAARVDGVVLVLRLARQGRPQAERAREILTSMGVKVMGVVVNGVNRQLGGTIYSSGNYEYAESYTKDDKSGKYDSDYYDYYQEHEAPKNGTPSDVNGSTR